MSAKFRGFPLRIVFVFSWRQNSQKGVEFVPTLQPNTGKQTPLTQVSSFEFGGCWSQISQNREPHSKCNWHLVPSVPGSPGWLRRPALDTRMTLAHGSLSFTPDSFKKSNSFLAVVGLRCHTQAFSSCGARGLLLVAVHTLFIAMASLAEHTLQGTWAQSWLTLGSRALAQELWSMGLVAPWHVGSSQIRDQTCVPCIARQILNHWTIREAPPYSFLCLPSALSDWSSLETLKSCYYPPHILFLAFMLGVGVIVKMTSHSALCLSLTTEASCHMFISGSALLQSFSTEWFFSPSPGTCGNVCRHFWLSQLVSWGGVRLASSG